MSAELDESLIFTGQGTPKGAVKKGPGSGVETGTETGPKEVSRDVPGSTLEDSLESALEGSKTVTETYPLKDPKFKARDLDYDYKNYIHDYVDLAELGKATEKARIALFMVTEESNKVSRVLAKLKLRKEKAWRRAFLDSTQKTDAHKRLWADLLTEDLEDDVVAATQLYEELQREAHTLRVELQTLMGVGNNIRLQMRN